MIRRTNFKLCRGCMSSREDSLQDLFKKPNLSDIFVSLTSLAISPHDELPNVLCTVCIDNLYRYNTFKEQCLTTHKLFIQNITSGKDNNPDIQPSFEHFNVEEATVNHSEGKNRITEDEPLNRKPKNDHQLSELTKKTCKTGFTCDKCNRNFKFKSKLNRHLQLHITPTVKLYKCDICLKTLPKLCKLKKHILVKHTTTQIVFCEHCGKKFSEPLTLRRHMELLHINARPLYNCLKCPKTYTTIGGLKHHQYIHDERGRPRPYLCNYCGQSFSSKQHLKMHMRTHTGERPYKCKTCGKQFAQSNSLYIHRAVHAADRPTTVCPVCLKEFKQKSLKVHLARHTDKPQYFCDMCQKPFHDKAKMTEHRRTHTGEKPFLCSYCPKSYARKQHLKVHQRIHHQGAIGKL